MKSVDVIIVNWNSGPHLARCLAALAETSARPIVVDNASTDGSDEAAARAGVALLRNPGNLGFAAACNRAAQAASADYLLFLNPDAAIGQSDLDLLIERLEATESSGFGIAGPRLKDAQGHDQPSCSALPRWRDLAGRMIGLDLIGLVHPPLHLPKRSGPVGQVMGAAMLMPRTLFERLQGFDTGYFLYFEDLDLAGRARALGFQSLFVAEAVATHAGHGSSGRVKSRRLLLWLTSRHRYARRNFGAAPAWMLFGLACTLEPLARSIRLVIAGRGDEVPGALKAHLAFAMSLR